MWSSFYTVDTSLYSADSTSIDYCIDVTRFISICYYTTIKLLKKAILQFSMRKYCMHYACFEHILIIKIAVEIGHKA